MRTRHADATCGMRHAVCGNKWLQRERIGVIPCANAVAVCGADTDAEVPTVCFKSGKFKIEFVIKIFGRCYMQLLEGGTADLPI